VIYSECPDHFAHNIPFLENFGNTLGKFKENVRKTGKLGTFKMFLTFPWNFPKVFPKFSKNGILWAKWSGHSEYITLEHFGHIVPMHFEFYWLSKL
jgi:hypothetical protein